MIRERLELERRSGDRVGVDGSPDLLVRLAADAIRYARMAASIHLADSVTRPPADAERARHRALDADAVTREKSA